MVAGAAVKIDHDSVEKDGKVQPRAAADANSDDREFEKLIRALSHTFRRNDLLEKFDCQLIRSYRVLNEDAAAEACTIGKSLIDKTEISDHAADAKGEDNTVVHLFRRATKETDPSTEISYRLDITKDSVTAEAPGISVAQAYEMIGFIDMNDEARAKGITLEDGSAADRALLALVAEKYGIRVNGDPGYTEAEMTEAQIAMSSSGYTPPQAANRKKDEDDASDLGPERVVSAPPRSAGALEAEVGDPDAWSIWDAIDEDQKRAAAGATYPFMRPRRREGPNRDDSPGLEM